MSGTPQEMTLDAWKRGFPLEQDGVIVGCTKSHEWMLPWWWMHYHLHNDFPVTFFDFGDMSPAAKAWCSKRGVVEPLNIPTGTFVANKEQVPTAEAAIWEKHKELDVWKARLEWFKKPFACLQSPYKRTIWIDLDCQVRKSVAGIFSYCDNDDGMALAEEPYVILLEHIECGTIQKDEIEYNTGVIAFTHGSPIISNWAKYCMERNTTLRGDQEALSHMLMEEKKKLAALPIIYNSRFHLEVDKNTVIVHWLGTGKTFIEQQLQIMSKRFFMDFSFLD
jgi:hypothetical protein